MSNILKFKCRCFQGIYSSELDDLLKLSWAWMLKFKDEIYTLASKVSSYIYNEV